MEGSKLGGVLRLVAGTVIVLLALLAILVVADVIPRDALREAGPKLVAVGAIVAVASALVALMIPRR